VRWLTFLALAACAPSQLRAIPPDATISLPRDHAPHADAQTEWWHVHAELEDLATGEPLYLFAGFVVQRTELDRAGPVPMAALDTFHAAYVKVQTAERSWVSDREGFPDGVTARFASEGLDLQHGDWRVAWEAGALVLEVSAGPHRLALQLEPTRGATLPGDAGRVELRPGSRHLWVQEERMHTRGRWETGGRARWVEGSGFYKHQWGRLYDDALDGFEWISMNLPGEHSLSIAWLKDGELRGAPGSLAWLSEPDGSPAPLPLGALRVTPTRTWRSPRSGNRWAVGWRVTAPGLDLEVEALDERQELWVFPASIYAGPARATGRFMGQPVDTIAFVEQAGGRPVPLRVFFHSDPPPDHGSL